MRQNFAYESIAIQISTAICPGSADNSGDLPDASQLLSTSKKFYDARLKQKLMNRAKE
ncbi:MAG TPA: hypothetical protein VL282_09280 [Tepidisphaeraceae bacterium]|nr:hypothetical protein [Tepidisphaeraceae bacterium]